MLKIIGTLSLGLSLLFPLSSYAQEVSSEALSSFVDVLTHPSLQNRNIENAQALSRLEDLEMQNKSNIACGESVTPEEKSCEQYQSKLLPKHLREAGWQVLFEAKYKPLHPREENVQLKGTGAQTFEWNVSRVENYYQNNPTDSLNLASEEQLRAEAYKIAQLYPNSSPQEFYGPLLLNQLQETKNFDEMMTRFTTLSRNLNDTEFTHLMTHFGGWAEYNYPRAGFEQTEGAGKGLAGPWDIITKNKNGICGDIHSMVAKFAEQRGWEAFTVGYALNGEQHVVTAMVNPQNPDKLMVVNYGQYEEHALNHGNSVLPAPTSPGNPGMAEIGMQLRIFKNTDTGNDGAMKQIGTVPTPLGSFMRGLFDRKDQITRAMPENENYTYVKTGGRHQQASTELKEDGSLKERKVSQGVIIYEGETDNAHIYGIAVNRDVFKNLYVYDPSLKKCVKKRSGYFSLGVAGSIIDLPNAGLQDTYYIYLNMRGGKIFHIYQTNFFQFKGLIGYELEAMSAGDDDRRFLTADGNLSTFAGVMAEYEKNGTALYGGIKLETNVGLKNQNLMTDTSALAGNIQPFGFNAVSVDFGATQKLSENLTWRTDNNYVLSRVGARVILSTGVVMSNTSIMLNYQSGVRPLPLRHSLEQVNLLQNMNGQDGLRLQVSQKVDFPRAGLKGTVAGYVGTPTSGDHRQPFFGASLKLNFRPRSR